MIALGVVYLLVSVVLFAVAVVVHFNSSSLSLPFTPAISILAAILPIAGFINAYVHPNLLYSTYHPSSSSRLRQLTPFVLQTLQALITTILATLLLEITIPSEGLSCALENEWLSRFRAHDAGAIRRAQDTLDCCGFNSVKDRAYPFPKDGEPSTCAETYGRSTACRDPWTAAMRANAGVDFAIVLAVGLLQVFGLLMMREGTNWWTSWRTRGWGGWRQAMGQRECSRPLLTGSEQGEESGGQNHTERPGYGGTEEDGEETGMGPSVEPSGIHEGNSWANH